MNFVLRHALRVLRYQLTGQEDAEQQVGPQVAGRPCQAGRVDQVRVEPEGHQPHAAAQRLCVDPGAVDVRA